MSIGGGLIPRYPLKTTSSPHRSSGIIDAIIMSHAACFIGSARSTSESTGAYATERRLTDPALRSGDA